MSIGIELIKTEPEESQSTDNDEINSNSYMEQPGCAPSAEFINNFVGIKQEVIPDITVKLEPVDDQNDAYEREDLDPERVLMKLEHSLLESNDIIKIPRASVVQYKEDEEEDDDSDEEYLPQARTVKIPPKKIYEPNVKPVFKGRPKIKEDQQTYSDDITCKIDIVTIDEAARAAEHRDALAARRHMNYVCERCAVGFVVEEAFHMHLKIHAPEAGAYQCDICQVRLKSSDMQYQHRLRHFRRYRCSICKLQQRDKDTVAAHIMREHMGIAFECHHCGRDFKRPQYLHRHIKQMHTKPLRLECPVCQRVFHERGWYRCHVRTHNEQVKNSITRKVVCSHCGREFRNKQYLVRHMAVHEDRRPKPCDHCSRTFKNSEVLRVHKRQHHGNKPVRDYVTSDTRLQRFGANTTCAECGRVLTTPAMLTRHTQRMHTERIKKFVCDYCQKGFFSKAEVRSHIEWTHLQQRRHACACGRVFRSPALLRDHALAQHLNIRQPRDKRCGVCGKMFSNQQVLTRHIKSHSGETYPCAECGQTFKTQSYVKVHYKIKHLNMTRAQVKAQSKRKLIMVHSEEPMNAKIKVNKKSKVVIQDPLSLDNYEKEKVILNETIESHVPLFETFVDIKREYGA